MGKEIRLKNIDKSFGDNTVLKNIDFTINAGERVVLLGPSGSGKSTLLRVIAGLEAPTKGEVYLDGQLANDIECGDRDIAMVFQNYALYPHLNVEDNIGLGLHAKKLSKKEVEERITETLEMLGLSSYRKRLPQELSGGQRQRVALARALVKRSEYFLLDEPLSNLDVRLRLDARKELTKLHDRFKQTFVYVTHDQIEAMTLAHRIVLLNYGEVQTIDTPGNVYRSPENVFTAEFIGSPGMNILEGQLTDSGIKIGEQILSLSESWQDYLGYKKLVAGDNVLLGIRPEHLRLDNDQNRGVRGKVSYVELLGEEYALTIQVDDLEVIARAEELSWQVGDEVSLHFTPNKIHFFDQKSEANLGYPKFEEE